MTFQPLEQFFERSQIGTWFPSTRYISTNPSPCTFGPIDSECMVKWRPVPREMDAEQLVQSVLADVTTSKADIDSLNDSFESLIDIIQFTTSYWSGPVDCRFEDARLILDCGVWNEADLRRKMTTLRHTLHNSLASGHPTTVPIAWSANDSGYFVGLHSKTGEVLSGMSDATDDHAECLAGSLTDFLSALRGVDGYFRETVQAF